MATWAPRIRLGAATLALACAAAQGPAGAESPSRWLYAEWHAPRLGGAVTEVRSVRYAERGRTLQIVHRDTEGRVNQLVETRLDTALGSTLPDGGAPTHS